MDVRRFGVGHRRPDGPPGTTGIEGQVIESGSAGTISELAFGRRARITPHTNPNTTYFIVIEGGGWVVVGDEHARVTAGEAVVWPPQIPHGAFTDGSPMRAIVVELPGTDHLLPGVVNGTATRVGPGSGETARRASRGDGRLAPRAPDPSRRGENPAAEEGEPL